MGRRSVLSKLERDLCLASWTVGDVEAARRAGMSRGSSAGRSATRCSGCCVGSAYSQAVSLPG